MQVTCITIGEFLENLNLVKPEGVFQQVVYVSISHREIDEVRYTVNIQASAVIAAGDGEYLLDVGMDCGEDCVAAPEDYSGTEEAKRQKKVIQDHCVIQGLKVRPGVVSY